MRSHLSAGLLRLWVMVIALIFGAASCNLPTSQAIGAPDTVTTPMLDTPTSSISTPTLTPATPTPSLDPPTITPTSTPRFFLARPKDQPVNCRFGPEISYAVTGALMLGKQAEVIGRNSDSTWWYVRNPSDPSTSCWLSAEFVETVGDVQSLPVVNPPTIMVTNIQVRVDPPVLNVACNGFPQLVIISADITTSGPTTVVWHWTSSTGFVSSDKQVTFAVGDTKTVQDYYQVTSINDYRIQVQTTLPNIMTGQASFKVICTP